MAAAAMTPRSFESAFKCLILPSESFIAQIISCGANAMFFAVRSPLPRARRSASLHLEVDAMAFFLLQVSYTSEAAAALLKNPADRQAALAAPLAKLGGTMDHAWLSFGDYDIVAVLNLPDNVSAAA